MAALALVVLIFTLALALAGAQQQTVQRMQAGAPTVKRWGGRVLVLVGAWFVALALFADLFADVFAV